MPETHADRRLLHRLLVACGAVLAACAVALAAYATHAVDAQARVRLSSAAAFLLAHGIALAALAPRSRRKLEDLALIGLLFGTVLFSGSLIAAHAFGWPTALAPFGGMSMIAAWLLYAAAALRR
jgi:uncharacterized membrane protein YgdD (TMEM256/DUF423 family)